MYIIFRIKKQPENAHLNEVKEYLREVDYDVATDSFTNLTWDYVPRNVRAFYSQMVFTKLVDQFGDNFGIMGQTNID
jgi:hypothetical protein